MCDVLCAICVMCNVVCCCSGVAREDEVTKSLLVDVQHALCTTAVSELRSVCYMCDVLCAICVMCCVLYV